jgi:hypothetical protein
VNEHPENIAIPPSTDGFWFCAWDAVDGDTAQYRQARAGMIPCPIAGICPTRAAHLALIAQRKTSIIWPTLTLREKKRIRSSAQGLLFKAEQQLGAHVVGPAIKAWLENEVGTLIGVRMRKLLEPLTAQAIPPATDTSRPKIVQLALL